MAFYNNNNNTNITITDESDSGSISNYRMSLDALRAMREQENRNYKISTAHLEGRDEFSQDILVTYLEWRRAMIGWIFNIASTCKFQNDTVEIAVSIVDRFVAVRPDVLSQSDRYQVVCMTSLYIAVKIHELQCLTPKQMETLSCGRVLAQDIEDVEQQILKAIEWRVNPPTAAAFARKLLELIPIELVADRSTVLDVAELFIHLAMPEHFSLEVNAASLAMASVMNALRCVLGHSDLRHFYDGFSYALMMNEDIISIESLQIKLGELVVQSLSSGKLLNEAMVIAYQDAGHGYSKRNNLINAGPDSPRSVNEKCRCVKVQTW